MSKLEIYYDFSSKELGIQFPRSEIAQTYQNRNREARIYAENRHTVWLPIPGTMKRIRASQSGFVISFKSTGAASEWHKRVGLGSHVSGSDEASIQRDWIGNGLKEGLTGERKQSEIPGQTKSDAGASSTRKTKVTKGDDVKKEIGFGRPVVQQRSSSYDDGEEPKKKTR